MGIIALSLSRTFESPLRIFPTEVSRSKQREFFDVRTFGSSDESVEFRKDESVKYY